MDDPPCSSSSSSSLPRPRDVFLNFRGEDTRSNFVCHLHSALKRALVNVYLDDEELKEGDDLSKLFKAIEESKISVVVFSENYATSKWCLNELVKIMDCKVNQKQTVIPIFYRVDPSHVRKQTGSFGQAFDEHELSLGKDKDLVQSWRKALTEATNLTCWDFKYFVDDAELIDEIVESVFNKLLLMLSTSKESDLVGKHGFHPIPVLVDLMDEPSSSSSPPPSSLPIDVFLNFRGEDTRNNFVCHLHSALKRALVNVYLDDEELKEGDDLSKLFKAIEESKISVVVFSENYATSKWCLNELVKIMDCKVNQKQTVIPIFYRVNPSHIRKQTGSFGKAFDEHELSLGKDNDLVQSWRSALKEASNIVGRHSTNE